MIEFYSTKNIEADEELTINYTGDPDSTSLKWFKERNIIYRH